MQTECSLPLFVIICFIYTIVCGAHVVFLHIRDTPVIKRGRPLFRYLGRVSPINTATRCCLNIYSARVEDSINLTNLEYGKLYY